MADTDSENFDILTQLYRNDLFSAWKVRQGDQEQRLTRMSRRLSEIESFRAAFRKDQATLSSLNHDNILHFEGWGEHDGQLYYLTELSQGKTLSERLTDGESFSEDEVTDIGWQIASALQHAHNQGVVHGHLTPDSIIVEDPLRIKVAGFGLYRWIAAADEDTHDTWSDLATRDLAALGNILTTLSQHIRSATGSDAGTVENSTLQTLIEELREPGPELMARDVQGRLGNILLQIAGDSIEMVDHREGQGLSRRSIVDELFDSPAENTSVTSDTKQASLEKGCLSSVLTLICAGAAVVLGLCVAFD